jgi:hypothetical protein
LQIANEFLIWSQTGQLEEKFAKKVNFWAQAPFVLKMAYAAEARRAKRTFNFDDPGILAMETEESFGKFCQSIGYGDPIFWQKIYTRLRLEYTESSPRGNLPTDPETGLQ